MDVDFAAKRSATHISEGRKLDWKKSRDFGGERLVRSDRRKI